MEIELLQIIFQHNDELIGEARSAWIDLLIEFFGAALAFWGALFIFWGERRIQKRKERQTQLSHLAHFCLITDTAHGSLKRRAELTKEYIVEQNKDKFGDAIFAKNPIRSLDRLLSANPQNLQIALETFGNKAEWSQDFNKFYKALDNIEGFLKEMERLDRKRMNDSERSTERFKKLFETLTDDIANNARILAVKLDNARFNNNAWNWLNNFIGKFHSITIRDNQSPKSLKTWNDELIEPELNKLLQLEEPELEILFSRRLKALRVLIFDVERYINFFLREIEKLQVMLTPQVREFESLKSKFDNLLNEARKSTR